MAVAGLFALPGLNGGASAAGCTTYTPSVGGVRAGVGTEPSYSMLPPPVPNTVEDQIDHQVVCVEAAGERVEVRHMPGISFLGDPLASHSTLVGDGVQVCDFWSGGAHFDCVTVGVAAMPQRDGDTAAVGASGSACENQPHYPHATCYLAVVRVDVDGPTKPTMGASIFAAVCQHPYNRPYPECVFIEPMPVVREVLEPLMLCPPVCPAVKIEG